MKCWVYWVHLSSHKSIKTDGYVGVTTKGIKAREKQHKKDLSCNHLANAILKYGDTLIWEQVFTGTVEGCYQLENYFRPSPGIGWNIAIGGAVSCNLGRSISEESKQKLREAHKGKIPWWITADIKLSEALNTEQRIKTVKERGTFAGKNNPMYGKTHTKSARERIGKAHKGKIGMQKKDNPRARAIICIETGQMFDTISDAAEHLGCSIQNVSLCLRGKTKTAKGFSWKYAN